MFKKQHQKLLENLSTVISDNKSLPTGQFQANGVYNPCNDLTSKLKSMEISKNVPINPKSEKAIARFEFIIDIVEEILETVAVEDLGVQEVSKRTGLPTQAIYRIFPSPRALVHGLAVRYLDQIQQLQVETTPIEGVTWQERVVSGLSNIAAFYNARPLAMKLILGSTTTSELRAADRANVTKMAQPLITSFHHILHGPHEADMHARVELAIDIVDAVWSHSYYLHKKITPFFLEESVRASTNYLELYLGRHIPPVEQAAPA